MVEQVMSQSVDPHALLESLDALLGDQGNMKNLEEVDRIVGLMHESQKMVSRCIYLNVIKSTTDEQVLKKFINVGGWDILNTWLQEAKAENNIPLLTEILKVYNEMPVSLELLKKNNCAKTIKQLMKLDDEGIRSLSSGIVDCWMKTIKTKNEDKPKKKNKKHHHHHHHEQQKSSSNHSDTSGNHADNKDGERPVGSPDNNSNDSCDRVSEDSKESTCSSTSINTVSKPKTSKTAPSKFRATGLEVDTKLTPTSKKKLSAADPKDNLPFKKPSIGVVEKNTQGSTATSLPTSTSPTELRSKAKFIPPKRSAISELYYEGSGFMDALDQATTTSHSVRKKRRVSNEKGAMVNSKGQEKVPTSPDEKKPLILSSKPSEPSPAPTSPQDKKPLLPSFYKETLNTSEDNGHEEAEIDDSSPNHQEEETPTNGEVISADDDVEMKELPTEEIKDAESDKPEGSETRSETSSVTSETPVGMVRRKKRKRVHWADDAVLASLYYFELDETERVNVNRVKDFDETKRQELMLERRALQSYRKHSNDNMVEKVSWYRPPQISDLPSLSVAGCNSLEKQFQKERELIVLQALYFNKDMVPDSPKEPDPESYQPSDPRIMPLDDVTGESGEVTHTSYPAPVAPKYETTPKPPSQNDKNFSLPEDVAQILANITQSAKETASSTNNHQQKQSHKGKSQAAYAQQSGSTMSGVESLPAEMQQMLTAFSQQHMSPTHTLGSGLPAHIEGYLQHIQTSGQYTDNIVEHFNHMLSLTLSGASVSSQNAPTGMPPPGLLGYAPQGAPPPMNGPNMMPPRFQGDGPPRQDGWHGGNMMGPGPPNMPPWGAPSGMMMQPHMGGPPGPGGPSGPMGPPQGPPGGPPRMRGPGPRGRNRNGPPICKYFMQGKCSAFNCRFIHPGVNGPPV